MSMNIVTPKVKERNKSQWMLKYTHFRVSERDFFVLEDDAVVSCDVFEIIKFVRATYAKVFITVRGFT